MASSEVLPATERAALAAYPAALLALVLTAQFSWVAVHSLWVDGPLLAVAVAAAIGVFCTIRGTRRPLHVARIVAAVLFAVGTAVSLLLVSAMGALFGAYGAFGKAGAALGGVLLGGLIPLLIVFPWLWARAIARRLPS